MPLEDAEEEAPAIELEGLTKRFGGTTAVRGIDLEVAAGDVVALLGPNGAGKSTTVRMLCGLLRPSSGTLRIHGVPAAKSRRRIGYCPQANVFYPDLTVLENLRFAGALFRVPRSVRRWRARRIATELGLAAHMRKRAGALSGGMQRRLTLGLAAMHDPSVYVVEEPEAGLDPHSRIAVRSFLEARASDGHTIIFTSHDMGEVERLADRVAVLDDGILLAIDTPARLVKRVRSGELVYLDRPHAVDRAHLTLEDAFLAMTGASA